MQKKTQRKGKRRAKNNPWPGRLVLLCIIALLLFVAFKNGTEIFRASILSTTPAVSGVLEDKISGDSMIFAREKLITAQYSGKLTPLVSSGQRIRKNQSFAKLAAFGTTSKGKSVEVFLRAPTSGNMYYWWDGLEKIFTPAILGKSDIEKVFTSAKPKSLGETVREGEPAAKVVDNLEGMYCVTKCNTSAFKITPAKDDKLTLSFAGFRTVGTVQDVKKTDSLTYILMQITDLPPAFKSTRHVECVIIPQQYKGVVLPREALVTKEQGPGVFVLETKKTVWHPVSLVGETGNNIVVEGLGPTQEVITNPQWIEDK